MRERTAEEWIRREYVLWEEVTEWVVIMAVATDV